MLGGGEKRRKVLEKKDKSGNKEKSKEEHKYHTYKHGRSVLLYT